MESTIVDLMSPRTGLPRHDFMVPIDVSPADVSNQPRSLVSNISAHPPASANTCNTTTTCTPSSRTFLRRS
ncbi:hypothetical protein MVEN_02277900 [Mycena venus]|uniref:Uncharacterized protein n=1 Tax=Mycena venus TaxID=2733690 RepID=A0A8H6X5A0_9AGAR|nr:hypothetical protein MVEN_02277900 [Mycena venus]